jgi:transposase
MMTTMILETELDRLRAENARLVAQRDAALTAKATLERKVTKLEHAIDDLLRRLFGRSSERIDPRQILLEFAAEASKEPLPAPPHVGEAPDGEAPEAKRKKKKKKSHGWRKLPEDLPRKVVELWPSEEECTCGCGARRISIGSPEITERYDYKPASVHVVQTIRHRVRCPRCEDRTVIAPLPPAPIEGARGRAEAGMLAQVVVSKFNDHLPLHRQEEILSREGVDISRSTLCDWVKGTAELLRPVADAVLDEVLSGPVVGLDETAIRIVFDRNDPKNGTRNGRIWVYRGQPGEVFFTASETKAKADVDGPMFMLADYTGFVQADAAGVFDDLYLDGRRVEIGCNCHARRKFFEAKKSSPKEAAFAIATYKKVYEIEERVRDASPEERLAARQRETKPILAAFDAWIDELAASPALVPGTPLASAVGYSRNHRAALRRFLDDPRLSPDNNAVERALRLVAVGRKNWLFAGSEDAAHDAAALYTLVASCRELGVEPWAYFRDVIERRAKEPTTPAATLTPRAWWAARRALDPPK